MDNTEAILTVLARLTPDEELVEKLEQLLELNGDTLDPDLKRYANRLTKIYREIIEETYA